MEFIRVRKVVLNGFFDNPFNVLFSRFFTMTIGAMLAFVMRLLMLEFLVIFALSMR
jgi:uncharacterized membrane protein YgaE (UPF0421/DUF939 family)